MFYCDAKILILDLIKNLKLKNPIASSFEGGLRRVTVLDV
jgi:hypothetical protein